MVEKRNATVPFTALTRLCDSALHFEAMLIVALIHTTSVARGTHIVMLLLVLFDEVSCDHCSVSIILGHSGFNEVYEPKLQCFRMEIVKAKVC